MTDLPWNTKPKTSSQPPGTGIASTGRWPRAPSPQSRLHGAGTSRIFRRVTVRRLFALMWLVVARFASSAQGHGQIQPWGATHASVRAGTPGALEKLWVELERERLTNEGDSLEIDDNATFVLRTSAAARSSRECKNQRNPSHDVSVAREQARNLERQRGPPSTTV